MPKTIIQIFRIMLLYIVYIYLEVRVLNEQKLEKLLGFYKQYKALSEYIDKEYKLTLNDLAVLDLARKYCSDEQILMQSFLKIAISELELSRTKLLVSIRRLIDKEKLSKVRSTRDERKIFLYMSEENLEIFNALFDDVENFLNIYLRVSIYKYYKSTLFMFIPCIHT